MSKNLFTSSLLQFMDYFVKKYDTKKQCLLVSTQSAIIKGNLSFVSNLKNKMKPLNFKVYTDDHSNFINWHNTSAIHDRISYFSLSMDEIKPFHEAELDPIIHYDDVIIISIFVFISFISSTEFLICSNISKKLLISSSLDFIKSIISSS